MKIKQRASQQLNSNVRFQALIIIHEVMFEEEYSNIRLQKVIEQNLFSDKDQALLVRLVYGSIQHYSYLSYQVDQVSQGRKLDTWVRVLLTLSLYQLLYLDRIPDHAVINEAVTIAKTNGHGGLGNFVNAILRKFQRQGEVDIDESLPEIDQWAIRYSIQKEIIEILLEQRPASEVEALLGNLNQAPYLSVRIQPKKTTREDVKIELMQAGYDVEDSPISPYGLRLREGNVVTSLAYREGRIIVQDESSMLVAPIGKLQGDEKVLDTCSAPGGKATHIASLLDQGSVLALDISEAKLNKVAQHAQRMDLSDWLVCQLADATTFNPVTGMVYDRIYVDAPCSGLGLMRRKPEIKHKPHPQAIKNLREIQYKILENIYTLLAPGGILVYSTCTISREENELLLEQWLQAHPDMTVDPITPQECQADLSLTDQGYIRIWPDQYHTDGFFIARMTKESKSDTN